MIANTYRCLLNKRRFISYLKYRKYIARMPYRVVTMLKRKLKSVPVKELKNKMFSTFLFRNPTKKLNYIPRSYFIKYRIPFNYYHSGALYVYFAVPSFSRAVLSKIKDLRRGDRVYMEVSRHINLASVSLFDDFFHVSYSGQVSRVNNKSLSFLQGVNDVMIKHDFYSNSPNIIHMERGHV